MNVKIVIAIIVAVAISAVAISINMSNSPSDVMETKQMADSALPEIVNIGVLLPATGDIASHGQDSNISAKLAKDDFNKYLQTINATWRMNLIIEDTQTDPIIALEKLQSLNSKGVKQVLGTQTSSELRNVKSYADSNGMILVSPSSTSPKLAIDDNIFRLVPDDTKQGVVIAELLSHHNIKVVIPIYRADVWGDGLYASSKLSFEDLGGIVDDGIRYSPEVTVFSTEASLLSDRLDSYLDSYTVDEIAVLLIAFDESVHLINSAHSYDNLGSVMWFGSDASANDDKLTDDRISLEFIQDVGFVATQFSASKNDVYQRVHDHFIDTVGSSPNNYAYSAYDGVWLLGLTIQQNQSLDSDILKQNIADVAEKHEGGIGYIILNDNGDLDRADYELWSVSDDGQWELSGRYDASSNSLIFN